MYALSVMYRRVLPAAAAFAWLAGATVAPAGEEARVVSGTVKDGAGKAVAGARVLVLRDVAADGADAFLTAATDPDGAFTIDVPAGPASFHLLVGAPGRATLHVAAAVPGGDPLPLKLLPGVRLEGTVAGREDLAPLAGARVEVKRPGTAPAPPGAPPRRPVPEAPDVPSAIRDRLLPAAVTGKDGLFVIDGLRPGLYDLKTSATHRRTSWRNDLIVTAGEVRRLDALLEATTEIAGKVLAGGKPVAAARVRLSPPELSFVTARGASSEPRRLATTSTAADGSFRFEEVDPGQRLILAAEHPDFAPVERAVTSGRSGEPLDADLELRRGARYAGVVTDEDGKPVAGARVLLVEAGADPLVRRMRVARASRPAAPGERRAAATATDGSFDLSHVAPGEWTVGVIHGGHESATGQVVKLAEGQELVDQRLEVALGKPLTGVVRDERGNPIAGATVLARARAGLEPVQQVAETDPDGRYEHRGLEGERVRLLVRAEGFGQAEREDAPAAGSGIDFVLKRTGGVAGRVALEGGAAPPAVSLWLTAAGEQGRGRSASGVDRTVPTDNGAYQVEGVPEGTWNVTFRTPEHVAETVAGVKVESGKTTSDVNATLRRGLGLAGIVTRRADGAAVAGAEVLYTQRDLREAQLMRDGESLRAVTDLAGRFQLDGLRPGAAKLLVTHPDFADAPIEIEPKDGGEEKNTVAIALGTGGAIAGRVTGPGGTPERGAYVQVHRMRADFDVTLETDADGRYHLGLLAPGTYVVSSYGGRGGPGVTATRDQSKSVTVREGETAEASFAAHTGRMSGLVRRGDRPLAGARLLLMSGGLGEGESNVFETTSDAQGRYQIEGVAPGKYRARITDSDVDGRLPGGGGVGLEVMVPDRELFEHDFVLADRQLGGRVVDASTREAVAGIEVVVLRGERSPVGGARTDRDGSFRVTLNEPGAYRIAASAQDGSYAPSSIDVEVGDGGLGGVEIALERGEQVTGVVLDASGQPLGRTGVSAEIAGAWTSAVTDVAGRFVLRVPATAPVNLMVRAQNHAMARVTGVRPGGDEVVVRLTRGGTLELKIAGPPELRAGARIDLRDAVGVVRRVASGVSSFAGDEEDLRGTGRVVVRNLAAGTYSITVFAGGRDTAAIAVVEEGKTAVVDIPLRARE